MYPFLQVALLQLAVLIKLASCSFGDKSHVFQSCLANNKHLCQQHAYPATLPLYLRVFGWECLDEIKYQCMHNSTTSFVRLGYSIPQYYGKWPFVRFLGIQEPASVLFSLANMIAHVVGWIQFSKTVTKEYKLYNSVKFLCLANVNAWIWSTVYHSRDLDFTEKMDYFCATMAVLSSVIFCFMRIVGDAHKPVCYVFVNVVLVLFAYHVYQMGFVKFDYGYNMKFNVTCGITNALMWLCWCFMTHRNRRYVWKIALAVIGAILFLGLELFDFPPIWWIFDAHSLWHLATVPLCLLLYNFLTDDGKYELLQIARVQKIP